MSDSEISHFIQAGQVKVGDIVLIREHPCKVLKITKFKTGKHGASKVCFEYSVEEGEIETWIGLTQNQIQLMFKDDSCSSPDVQTDEN